MKVTSLIYFAVSFLAALIYRRLPRKWGNLWLLTLSIGFVVTWSWQFVILLAAFTCVNYWLARRVDASQNARGRWTTGGIFFNVAFLFLLKYNQFYLPAIHKMMLNLGLTTSESLVPILVPIGLSFLAVQAISTLLDIKTDAWQPNEIFSVFQCTFSITRSCFPVPSNACGYFFPGWIPPLPLDRSLLERSTALLLIGLFRKIAIADPLFNMIPAEAFINPLNYPGQDLVFWLLAYSFALYNDFAGYTSIIRGVSLWFGIELTNNFNLPYLSRNFTEFWTRWHISLSQWLRDYIFFPSARYLMKHFTPREHWVNILLPPILTMLVSGMWHGLTWNLLLWGGMHGTYLVVERVFSLRKNAVPMNELPMWRQGLSTVITFVLAALAWVPFRMPVGTAVQYWQGMLHWVTPDFTALKLMLQNKLPSGVWSQVYLPSPLLLAVLVIAVIFDIQQSRGQREEFILDWSRLQIILFVVFLGFITLLAALSDHIIPFVYQGF